MNHNMNNMSVDFNEDLTPVQRFYHGKSVFITGASGIIGKMLLEKLLRSCPGIGMIYILLRPKRSLNPEERLDKILGSELFVGTKKVLPNLKKKITIISGDLEHPMLGISQEDIETIKFNVNIIFHIAASINFAAKLKYSMKMNTRATKDLIAISKECRNMKVFLYVSTIYAHKTEDDHAPECVDVNSVSPSLVLDTIEWLEDEDVEKITPNLTRNKMSTYLYSKYTAENLMHEMQGGQTMAIVRPSMILPSYDDPFPGWIDGIQTLSGISLALGKGFLRCMRMLPHLVGDLVPVDRAVSTLVTTAWYSATKRKNDFLVVNCTMERNSTPTLETLLKMFMSSIEKYPLTTVMRLPSMTFHKTKLTYYIHATFAHYIPGIIGDLLLYIFTGKTILMRLYRRIDILQGFMVPAWVTPWTFEKKNFHAVKNSLSEKDSKIFNMETEISNFPKYAEDMIFKGRQIIAHEDPSSIPYARKKAKIWRIVTTGLEWGLISYISYYILNAVYF